MVAGHHDPPPVGGGEQEGEIVRVCQAHVARVNHVDSLVSETLGGPVMEVNVEQEGWGHLLTDPIGQEPSGPPVLLDEPIDGFGEVVVVLQGRDQGLLVEP